MAKPELLFAMRLHCLILTSSALTPVISLNYLPKVTTYLKSLGLENYSMSFEHFSAEAIAHHISSGWENRKGIRAILEQRIPVMKREADKAAEIVAAIRRGEDVSRVIERLRVDNPHGAAELSTPPVRAA
jgi:polysaccharide pyruvyl transferase WcaK-like protein